MITLSAEATGVLGRSYSYHLRVQSWRGGDLLHDDLPVSAASEEADRTIRVPERVTLTLPRISRNTSWSPVEDDHPCAANGQRIRVELGVGIGGGQVEWFQRGWYLIQDTTTEGDTVTVTAVGLLALVEEARLVSPYQPTGTLVSTLRGLIEPALTVVVDDALTDRAVPSGINYDEDRLGAVNELLDAWPADSYVTEEGYLYVGPADVTGTSVATLTNGVGGTIITASGESTREGAFNAVVARGTTSAGIQVQGVTYDLSGGPKSYGGPFNPLPVPYFYFSPLVTTAAQAKAAATKIMNRLKRQTGRAFTVDTVPDPRLQVGDFLTVTTDDVTNQLVSVETLTLPLTPGGTMKLGVRTA